MSPKHLSRECPGDLALPPQSPGVGVAFNVTLVRGISLYGPWSTMLWPQDIYSRQTCGLALAVDPQS